MAITFQKAGPEDCPEIHALQIRAFKPLLDKYQDDDTNPAAESIQQVQQRFSRPDTDHWILSAEATTVGILRVRNFGEVCWLSQICIAPGHQNRGYAQEALQRVEELYPEARRWELVTILQEDKLRYLYEKMGYTRTELLKPIKDGMDLVGYAKEREGET